MSIVFWRSGVIAQLGERLHGMQEVNGSIPFSSTNDKENNLPDGGIAQLGEHLLCKQRVYGSIPYTSTITLKTLKRSFLLPICCI